MTLRRRARESLTGYLFIAPAVGLIALFGVLPIFFTLYVSLFRWRIHRGAYVGLENYRGLFGSLWYLALFAGLAAALYLGVRLADRSRGAGRWAGTALLGAALSLLVYLLPYMAALGDPELYRSMRVTIWYAAGTVPVQLALGLLVAVMLHRRLPGTQAFRVLYLLPYVAPTVASAAVFQRIFSLRPQGLANQLVGLLGAAPLQWLYEPRGVFQLISGGGITSSAAGLAAGYWLKWAQGPSLALVAIMLYNWWVFVGYYALIYMTGLTNIPRHLYEAAQVDGADGRTLFFRITVPLLSPTTYFLSLLGVIGTFKAFTHIYVLRNAAVGPQVDPLSVTIFFIFFGTARFGYAAAMSLVLFVVVLLLTLVQRSLMEGRISYGD